MNTYIVPLEGPFVFIVDPACSEYSDDLYSVSRYLEQYSFIPVCIVLTHGHFDHVAGIKHLCSTYSNLPVFIHEGDSKMIGSNSGFVQGEGLSRMGFRDFIPYVSDLPEASSFLCEGNTLLETMKNAGIELNDMPQDALSAWKVLHTPGHTQGSCCIYNEREGLLLSGDTVFYHSWGRTDLPGGSEEKIMASLKRLYSSLPENTKVFPGHDFGGFSIKDNY